MVRSKGGDDAEPWVPLEHRLPDISGKGRPRRIYVDNIDRDLLELLIERNYEPVELMALPRETEPDQLAYLRAKLQAYEERTVWASEEDRKRLELEARAWGMLGARTRQLNVNVDAASDDIMRLLDWDPGRHTLSGNTTAVFAQAPPVGGNKLPAKPKRKKKAATP